jgi:lipopolysaccharide biosynthesis glycosyltransferase
MKWFFTLNDDHNFFELAKVAIATAKKNTKLEPVCMYSGNNRNLSSWLIDHGVEVIHHRATLEEFAVDLYKNNSTKPKEHVQAFFIRVDMPLFCPSETFLYADVDIMFLGDCSELGKSIVPKVLAAAPQENPWEFEDMFNNGVMVCNGQALKDTYQDFLTFIRENQKSDWCYEQESYNRFYRKMAEPLPLEYNWKAYWEKDRAYWYNGVAPRNGPIQILHFHGPKPYDKDELFRRYCNKWFHSFKETWYEIYESEYGSLPDIQSNETRRL